jgi:hypothetical protein
MATQNPFANDAVKGEIWEKGYLAGFNEPGVDNFPGPLAPDLLDVYRSGEQSGGEDHQVSPPNAGGAAWVPPNVDLGELPEHVALHALGLALEKIGVAAGGLIALVLTVLTIPGDTELHPLDPDGGPLPSNDDDTFVAVCPRSDHPLVQQGVTSDGYWTGAGRSTFVEAAGDMRGHGHSEAFVARCSVSEGTCGPVWATE